MTIEQDVLRSNTSPFIELFEVDLSPLNYTYYTPDIYQEYKVLDMPLRTDFNDLMGHSVNVVGSPVISMEKPRNSHASLKIPSTFTDYLSVPGVTLGTGDYSVCFDVFIDSPPPAGYSRGLLQLDTERRNNTNCIQFHKWDSSWQGFGWWKTYSDLVLNPSGEPTGWNSLIFIRQNNYAKCYVNDNLSTNEENNRRDYFSDIINQTISIGSTVKSWGTAGKIYLSNVRMYQYAIVPGTLPTLSSKLYLTNNTSAGQIVEFGGQKYYPWPIELGGLEFNSTGSPARPTLTLGNLDINKQLRRLIYTYDDLVGININYIRTFKDYLGTNSRVSAPVVKFNIGRKLTHTNKQIQFELRSNMDRENSFLPPRIMLREEFPGLGVNRGIK